MGTFQFSRRLKNDDLEIGDFNIKKKKNHSVTPVDAENNILLKDFNDS
jgi:hypothetical protein